MATAGLTYEQLETSFTHRNFKPLYFLYGEEQLLIDELQALLIEQALEPHERDFNLDVVYGPDVDAPSVLALCGSYPVMAQRRVLVVRHFERLGKAELFKAYAANPNPTTLVFLTCSGKPNLTRQPFRALKAHAAWAEFKPLYDRQLPGWITHRVRSRGRTIDADAAQMLAQLTGNNLRTAAAEIDKLITYIGRQNVIVRNDVLDVGGHSREFNVFELQRVVGERRYEDTMRIMERMLLLSSNRRGMALMVVSVLTAYFTKLRKLTRCQAHGVPEKGMAERIGVPVFFIKEYLASLRRYPPGVLEQAFAALLAADFELKGGSNRGEDLILTLLLRRLSS